MKMKNYKKWKIRNFGNSNTDTKKNHIQEKELRPSRIAKCCVESKHFSIPWEKLTHWESGMNKVSFSSVLTLQNCRGHDRKLSFQMSSTSLIFKAKRDLLTLLVSQHFSPMLIYRMEIRKDILLQVAWVLG